MTFLCPSAIILGDSGKVCKYLNRNRIEIPDIIKNKAKGRIILWKDQWHGMHTRQRI